MLNYTEVLERLRNIEQALATQNLLSKTVLTFKEACQYLGVSASFLYKQTSAREIVHSCPNGKMLYFKREDLDLWMQRNPQRNAAHMQRKEGEPVVRFGRQV